MDGQKSKVETMREVLAETITERIQKLSEHVRGGYHSDPAVQHAEDTLVKYIEQGVHLSANERPFDSYPLKTYPAGEIGFEGETEAPEARETPAGETTGTDEKAA